MNGAGATAAKARRRHLREEARRIFDAALRAADPRRATLAAIERRDGALRLRASDCGGAAVWRQAPWSRIHVAAFGKAACAMAQAASETLPAAVLGDAIAVTHHDSVRAVPGFAVRGAGHPLPDESGCRAAAEVAAIAGAARAGELVLVLISGGGSALLPAPAPGIALDEKIAATDLLLASGADIGSLNTVRKHLSTLKGGGLARLAAPADVHALILSDVIGDDTSTIASGPTVPDPTTFADALAVLERHAIMGRVPAAVRERLEQGRRGAIPETPKPGDPVFARAAHAIVGGNGASVAAAAAAAASIASVLRVDRPIVGEARDQAEALAARALEAARSTSGAVAIVGGGETTVTVRGKGRGGRNQELALAFALAAERLAIPGEWVFLSGGTDGRDGPTDAAGGLVDSGSIARLRAAGRDPLALLADNDAYRALDASGDLLRTGPTGTNVADVQVFLRGA